MPKLKEYSLPCCTPRYLNGKLNPNRVDRYYVKASSLKKAVELLSSQPRMGGLTVHHLRTYGYSQWGTDVDQTSSPEFKEEGVWCVRDYSARELIRLK